MLGRREHQYAAVGAWIGPALALGAREVAALHSLDSVLHTASPSGSSAPS